ncbi:MAG TPA: glycerophosphodiester phosphodiesterase [Saprospiraceae bacterium]|nr:glycerophosphodiester phosphodiesterase [Saprospiraceae bacterium]
MRDLHYPCLIIIVLLIFQQALAQEKIDWEGHRGCRGLMPENSLPGFLKAVELGVTTLELDVVISKDGQIVVSHEPWMSSVICSHPDGTPVTKGEEKSLNLYTMNYEDIQRFDCGKRGHPDFPSQVLVGTVKPTLKMVFRSIEIFASENKYRQPRYNIEIKSDPKEYNEFQPGPKEFVAIVLADINRLGMANRVTLQSFDINVLEELNKITPREFKISYLVEKGKDIKKNLQKLSFKPDVYSPGYKTLKQSSIEDAHESGIKVIPWTVNTKEEIEQLIRMGVDGIITDYPDLATSVGIIMK